MKLIDDLKLKLVKKKIEKKPNYFFELLSNGQVSIKDEELLEYFIENCVKNKYDVKNYIPKLLELGVSKYYFLNNEELRNYIIDLLEDFFKNEIRWSVDFPLSSISTELLSSESIKSQILDKIDCQKSGDILVDKLQRELSLEDIEKIKEIYSMLKQLGYVPFQNGFDDLVSPFYSHFFQKNCIDVGLIDSEIVNRIFEYKYEKVKEWVLSNSKDRMPEFYIIDDFKKIGNSEFCRYWNSFDSKVGIDTFTVVMNYFKHSSYKIDFDLFGEKEEHEIYDKWSETQGVYYSNPKEYFKENISDIRGTLFNKDGTLKDVFFSCKNSGTMLYDILYYNWESHCTGKDIYKYLPLFYSNLEKVPQEFQGIIKIWHDLGENDDLEQAHKNQETFLLYATGGHNVFAGLFEINGPTEKFYHNAKLTINGINVAMLISSDWMSHYTKEELAYIKFVKQNEKFFDYNLLDRLKNGNNTLDESIGILFKGGEVTRQLVEVLLWPENSNLRELIHTDSALYSLLTDLEKKYLSFYEKYHDSQAIKFISKDNVGDYFDKNGPTENLTRLLFENLEIEILSDSSIGLIIDGVLTNKDKLILEEYKRVPDNLKDIYKNYISENKDHIDENKIKFVSDLLIRISYSNASELSSHVNSLATMLLQSDDPLNKLDQIEKVFIQNNLPETAKIFLTFQILHSDNNLVNDFKLESNEFVSPVLRENAKDVNRLKNIIFSDLVKAAIYSNNKSIRDYVKGIEEGNLLLERISHDDFDINGLSSFEVEILEVFKNHLESLYINSMLGNKGDLRLTGDLINDLITLRNAFKPTSRYDLPDRIVRMFCSGIGIKSFNELKQILDDNVKTVDLKNRQASLGDFTINEGDFVKGLVDIRYLESILNNGSVAKEYLGESATSDRTPLDTDLSRVLVSGNINDLIDSSISATYGPVWAILRNNGRFNITRDSDGTYFEKFDSSKYEVFKTLNGGHYGIRTGFPSSEIDYFVVDGRKPEVYIEIVKNGFYIPVVDKKTEKVLFTPDDYDRLRTKMSGLSYYGISDYKFSETLESEEINMIASLIPESKARIEAKKQIIVMYLKRALDRVGLKLKNGIDGDLTEGYVELIDTGSTGRGTNMLNDGDFDFMLRVDTKIMVSEEKKILLKKALKDELNINQPETGDGDFRFKNVAIEGIDEPVDLDISFVQRTNKLSYSTDMALEDRLNTIKRVAPEKYDLVLANIILAKKILKNSGCYKSAKSKEAQGGLGGVGVENWILQNGGSLEEAARSFMSVANDKSFSDFKKSYEIWDFGGNHMADKKNLYKHDNFVNNMDEVGYEKMKLAMMEYLNYLENSRNQDKSSNISL